MPIFLAKGASYPPPHRFNGWRFYLATKKFSIYPSPFKHIRYVKSIGVILMEIVILRNNAYSDV